MNEAVVGINSGPTDVEKEYNHDLTVPASAVNEELVAQAEKKKKKSTIMTILSVIGSILTSQLFIHVVLVVKQAFIAAFGLIGPLSLKHIHPFVFGCGRLLLVSSTSIAMAVAFDGRWWLKAKKKKRKMSPVLSTNGEEEEQEEEQEDDRDCPWPFSRIRIPDWQDAILLFICGSLMTWSVFSYVFAVKWAPYTIVAILQPTMSAFACFFSVLLGREGISLAKGFGVFLAVAGSIGTLLTVILVERMHGGGGGGKPSGGETTFLKIMGALLELSSALVLALYLVTQKSLLNKGMPPSTFISWTFTIAFGLSMVVSAYFFQFVEFLKVPLEAWLGLLYAGLVTGTLNYVLSSFATKHTSPTIVAIYTTTAPVYSAVFMYVFRGETTTWWTVPSGLAIAVGVVLVAYGRHLEGKREKAKLEALKQDEEANDEKQGLLAQATTRKVYDPEVGASYYAQSQPVIDDEVSSEEDNAIEFE